VAPATSSTLTGSGFAAASPSAEDAGVVVLSAETICKPALLVATLVWAEHGREKEGIFAGVCDAHLYTLLYISVFKSRVAGLCTIYDHPGVSGPFFRSGVVDGQHINVDQIQGSLEIRQNF